MQNSRQPDELPAGTTLLHGLYELEEYLVRGGFGITYLARDTLDREYVIKECFPGALCCRKDGKVQPLSPDMSEQYQSVLRHFLREARRVARLNHPGIVGVHQVFEANGTAYMAMELVHGEDLLTIVEEDRDRLTPDVLQKLLFDALDAIDYIHGLEILHRDISPDNFLIDAKNHLTLIDFGAAREHAGRESRALSALLAVKDGYSPHEFYLTDVAQNAASDLYSLGATFYHLITGSAPPNSQDRVAALAEDLPDPFVPLSAGDWELEPAILNSIDKSLAIKPSERIESAQAWISLLNTLPMPLSDADSDLVDADNPQQAQEGDLDRVISRLVEVTNKDVKQGMPGQQDKYKGPKRRKARGKDDDKKPRQLVDMFGNPVKNVDRWLREQDRAKQTNPSGKAVPKSKKRPQKPKPAAVADEIEQPRSIGKMISACLPGRRQDVSPALPN